MSDTPDVSARAAGVFLMVAAATTIVMALARVLADSDQPTLLESLRAIEEARSMYGFSGAARFLSGVALLAAAWSLLRTWIIRERLGTPFVPYLFAASGIFTALSGICAVALAAYYLPESAADVPASVEATATLRWLTGKAGFSAAGAAIVVAARYQWMAGGTLMRLAPASAVVGIVMQLIWLDAAHRVSGLAFVLWLVTVGAMLATGRVERHFVAKRGGRALDWKQ